MADLSDEFNTELSPEEEEEFQTWITSSGKTGDLYDYDLRGAWKGMQSGDVEYDERMHLPDTYKKPNHPTFSVESKYSTAETPGGKWQKSDDGSYAYQASDYVVRQHGEENLQKYFESREAGNKLVLPTVSDRVMTSKPKKKSRGSTSSTLGIE